MVHWQGKLTVKDCFHDDALSIPQKADIISKRLLGKIEEWRGNGSFDEDECDELMYLAQDLKDSHDADEFDEIWEQIYDWADHGRRLWIETF